MSPRFALVPPTELVNISRFRLLEWVFHIVELIKNLLFICLAIVLLGQNEVSWSTAMKGGI
jgi:competence protein ComGF